jgi:hypothetical protein
MRHIVAVLVVLMLVVSASRSPEVYGQTSCTFIGGFARLRDLVGPEGVGACLEDEHLNVENGNVEQRTVRGMLVWRKIDNFTAFTDGGTTWINGPSGLESRPNGERLAWETDPIVQESAPPTRTPRPIPTFPPPDIASNEPMGAPRVAGDPVTGGDGTIAAASSPAPVGGLPPAPSAANSAAASTGVANTTSSSSSTAASAATPTAVGTPASAGLPPAPAASANAVAAAATTPTATPTKTATPKPAVSVKFTESPDDVDTGSDAHFEIETNAKKGSCSLTIEYRNSSDTAIGTTTIDDGKCEWKFTVPATVKTGKATAKVTVTTSTGTTGTADNSFAVKKGDSVTAGSIDVEIEADDLPDDVNPGEEMKINVDTNLKRRGNCELVITWPKFGPVAAESKMPDEKGKCSWTVKAPTDVPTKSTATIVVTARKDNVTYRNLTKEFKIR